MSFLWPTLLFSLAAIPVLVLLYLSMQRRRKRFALKFGNLGMVRDAGGRSPGLRRHIPALLFLAGLTILMLAMARPQSVVSLPTVEGSVILAFDVSGSMAAEDLKPTRMEAAKAAAREFVNQQPASVQIGVVAFSDGGFTVQTHTDDRQAILDTIDRLTPTRGTSLAHGILASLNAIDAYQAGDAMIYGSMLTPTSPTPTAVPPGTFNPAVIVLLTDGENTSPPEPLTAALEAARRGVRIYTIGVGSPSGIDLQVEDFIVHTQLDEPSLKQIAAVTGGAYYNAQNEDELLAIYNQIKPQWTVKTEKTEITSLFAGASIFVLLIAAAISLLWFSRLP